MLKNVHYGKRHVAPRILIYGTEGIGKSTFAAGASQPVFIPTEDGINQIETSSFSLCQSYGEVSDCLTPLIREEHEFRTVVVDSVA